MSRVRSLPLLADAALQETALPEASRQCGSCKACCTYLSVAEIGKAAGERCKNLSRYGCKIYKTRPAECASYECMWMRGFGENSHRPDKLGVLFTPFVHPEFGNIIHAYELKKKAFDKSLVKTYCDMVAVNTLLLMFSTKNEKWVWGGPQDMLDALPEHYKALIGGPTKKQKEKR